MDNQRVTLLVLLDLSSAFDTVDHEVLLRRLETTFDIRDTALQWFRSYLTNRSQRVSINGSFSEDFLLPHGVPQGSCLGPLLFTTDIKTWMTTDKLKLNNGKTKFIIIGTRAQLDKINITKLSIDQVKVSAVSSVRNLGTWFDNHLTMTTAINKTCQSGFYHLHNIRRIKRFLSFEDRNSIVQAIVMSRIDYCNSLLYGVTATNLTKLQWVQNAAARLVCSVPRHEHVTPSLINLYWLPTRFRINFKITLFAFKCIHGQAPSYLKNLIAIKK